MTARAFARVLASAILIGAQAAPAHATIAYLPLASGDASTADGYRFDGIGVVELPALRPVRQIAIAPATDYITVSPDGRTLVARESPPAPEAIAVYDARSGELLRRWPATGCALARGEVDWHPLRPGVLILAGSCFFNIETGVIEESPQTLGVNVPALALQNRFAATSDRNNLLVAAQAASPGGSATLVRVIDLRDPRIGRDYPALNGWGVIGFGETTLLSQRGGGMHYTDLASGADLGAVPMPPGWLPSPPARAFADGSIVMDAIGPGGQRLVRLRNRTSPGEFIAALPLSTTGAYVYLEIGRDYALFSDWLRPNCPIGPFPVPCGTGPMTITTIELSSGRSSTRQWPTQVLAAEGPYLAAGGAPVVPLPASHASMLLVLAGLVLLAAFVRRRTRLQ